MSFVGSASVDGATNALEVTPSDSADLAVIPRALYVGGQGTLECVMANAPAGAAAVTFVAVVGEINIRPRRILATGTTATAIVALY